MNESESLIKNTVIFSDLFISYDNSSNLYTKIKIKYNMKIILRKIMNDFSY